MAAQWRSSGADDSDPVTVIRVIRRQVISGIQCYGADSLTRSGCPLPGRSGSGVTVPGTITVTGCQAEPASEPEGGLPRHGPTRAAGRGLVGLPVPRTRAGPAKRGRKFTNRNPK